MVFSEIVGHKELSANLKKMVDENILPHAILFSEQAGCGALPLALALTQYIFCKTRRAIQGGDNTWELKGLFGDNQNSIPKDDSCQICSSCIKIRNLQHPDFYFIFPINTTQKVEKGKKVSIDCYYDLFKKLIVQNPYFSEQDLYASMELENKMGLIGVSEANWIIEKLNFTAFEGGSRVVLILYPERMNSEAANKLLKSIEEPSSETYFLLITNDTEKIIKTIKSRCRIVEVPPIEEEPLTQKISEMYKMPTQEAKIWAKCSLGSLGRAISLIEDNQENRDSFQEFVSLINSAKNRDLPQMLEDMSVIAGRSKEEQKLFCINALKVFREVFMVKLHEVDLAYSAPDRVDKIRELSTILSDNFIQKGYDIFNNAIEHIERNVNSKIIFTDMSNLIFLNI